MTMTEKEQIAELGAKLETAIGTERKDLIEEINQLRGTLGMSDYEDKTSEGNHEFERKRHASIASHKNEILKVPGEKEALEVVKYHEKEWKRITKGINLRDLEWTRDMLKKAVFNYNQLQRLKPYGRSFYLSPEGVIKEREIESLIEWSRKAMYKITLSAKGLPEKNIEDLTLTEAKKYYEAITKEISEIRKQIEERKKKDIPFSLLSDDLFRVKERCALALRVIGELSEGVIPQTMLREYEKILWNPTKSKQNSDTEEKKPEWLRKITGEELPKEECKWVCDKDFRECIEYCDDEREQCYEKCVGRDDYEACMKKCNEQYETCCEECEDRGAKCLTEEKEKTEYIIEECEKAQIEFDSVKKHRFRCPVCGRAAPEDFCMVHGDVESLDLSESKKAQELTRGLMKAQKEWEKKQKLKYEEEPTEEHTRIIERLRRLDVEIDKVPAIVAVGKTPTVIGKYDTYHLNFALDEISREDMPKFTTLTIKGKVWNVKKSTEAELLKIKLRKKLREEERREKQLKLREERRLGTYEKKGYEEPYKLEAPKNPPKTTKLGDGEPISLRDKLQLAFLEKEGDTIKND